MAIVVNKPLPEFEAMATGGVKVSNSSHLGQAVVLYFYPKDNTPGCTTEGAQFRDLHDRFAKAGAVVAGVAAARFLKASSQSRYQQRREIQSGSPAGTIATARPPAVTERSQAREPEPAGIGS